MPRGGRQTQSRKATESGVKAPTQQPLLSRFFTAAAYKPLSQASPSRTATNGTAASPSTAQSSSAVGSDAALQEDGDVTPLAAAAAATHAHDEKENHHDSEAAPLTTPPPTRGRRTRQTAAKSSAPTSRSKRKTATSTEEKADVTEADEKPTTVRKRARVSSTAGAARDVVTIGEDEENDTTATVVSTPRSRRSAASAAAAASASPPAARPAMHSFFSPASSRERTAASATPTIPSKQRTSTPLILPTSLPPSTEAQHEKFVQELVSQMGAGARGKVEPTNLLPVAGIPASSTSASIAAAVGSPSAASTATNGNGNGGTGGSGFLMPAQFDLRSWSGVPTTTIHSKFTPLEQQVLQLKRQHPDTILLVEVGYKYRFFGRDAEVAAHLLDIWVHPDHNLLTASIPSFRLYIHVRRLVEQGLKVGVVRQTESATSKKLEGTSGPFTRGIAELYTKSTMLPELGAEGEGGESGASVAPSRPILVLYEESLTSYGTNTMEVAPRVRCNLMAVDPTSGDVVWDCFEADFLRSEVETRLSQLAPSEILVSSDPAKLSSYTASLLLSYASAAASAAASGGIAEGGVRLEKLDSKRFKFDFATAKQTIMRFFETNSSSTKPSSDRQVVTVLDDEDDERKQADTGASMHDDQPSPSSSSSVASGSDIIQSLGLPPGALVCLGVLLPYLKVFGLDSLLRASTAFRPLTLASRHMKLDGLTLANLDIVKQSEGGTKGALTWLLTHTRTAFGGRMLRNWILHPLTDRGEITSRFDAIEELLSPENTWFTSINPLLHSLPDLERGLSRIYARKCKPGEFWRILEAFQRISQVLPQAADLDQIQSSFFKKLFTAVDLSSFKSTVHFFIHSLHASALEHGDQANFFRDANLYPDIQRCKERIEVIEGQLSQVLVQIRRTLGPEYNRLQYASVLNFEYLVEVKVADVKRVPKSWIQVNATKQLVRFHPPEVTTLLDQLQLARENLTNVSAQAWSSFLDDFSRHYGLLRHVIALVASIDCINSLSIVASQPGYCRPVFTLEHQLSMVGGRHPMMELSAQESGGSFVPNDISLHEDGLRFALVTGSNMGGKSTLLRQVALLVIMAQIGSFVPADSFELGVFDAVYTRMGARDVITAGMSTFLVELEETSAILRQATPRSLLIIDELGRGTSTSDGMAIAAATAEYIVTTLRSFTLFVTHYPLLGNIEKRYPNVARNWHMSYLEGFQSTDAVTKSDASSSSGTTSTSITPSSTAMDPTASASSSPSPSSASIPSITFLYRLVPGMVSQSFGLNVARMANVPAQVILHAQAKARQIRQRMNEETERRKKKETQQAAMEVKKMLHETTIDASTLRSRLHAITQLVSEP